MTFLLMDTSGTYCVLALADDADGTLLAASIFEGRRTLSRRLMGEIDGLLTRNNLSLADLSGLAVGLGPGSFTGVRVGVTTAKTLAQVMGKPLVGVGTLDAYAAVWSSPGDALLMPVLPSRKGEVYAAAYQNGECVEVPFAENVDTLAERLTQRGASMVCGQSSLLTPWTGPSLTQLWTPPEGLARLAAARLSAGDTDDPLSLVPLYVVAPSISTPKARP